LGLQNVTETERKKKAPKGTSQGFPGLPEGGWNCCQHQNGGENGGHRCCGKKRRKRRLCPNAIENGSRGFLGRKGKKIRKKKRKKKKGSEGKAARGGGKRVVRPPQWSGVKGRCGGA